MSRSTGADPDIRLQQHQASGKYIEVDDIKTFVLDKGSGEVIFCIHGVPTSSFLYRKLVDALAAKSYRVIAIDLPGLGLSDRPEKFEYNFKNFAQFLIKAIDQLGVLKFHLIVHDLGGPIGFALAANHLPRIASLTILNTWINVVKFKKPVVMKPFEKNILGEVELAMVTHLTWPTMFSKLGVDNEDLIAEEDKKVYVDLLKRKDNGKAFLKIMRNYPKTEKDRELCYSAVQKVPYPVQAVWGKNDPALPYKRYGKEIMKVAGLEKITLLPSKHLLQEEVYEEIADLVDRQATKSFTP